jgi:hypothetical protein
MGAGFDLARAGSRCHPLIDAVHVAFSQHRPLTLSPDDIWLVIAQGFGHHVAENAAALRPDAAALLRMDRKRKKKISNEDWKSPIDKEAEITKLKDGLTALEYKAENAVDLETGVIVAWVESAWLIATPPLWARGKGYFKSYHRLGR